MSLTRHAEARLQQRAIPPFVVDLLEDFGSTMRCGGADRLFFNKAGRKQLRGYYGVAFSAVEKYLRTYAVRSDHGSVVTVGYRSKRFKRP